MDAMPSFEFADTDALTFSHDGAQRFRAALDPAALHALRAALSSLPPDQAGIRIYGIAELRPILTPSGPVGSVAASVLGDACRPVRAILFDKTPATNWALAWHQDRTIAVAARVDVDGFGPWTIKNGLVHVAPPFGLLAGMATVRAHLDPVSLANSPLLIALGSHRLGRVPEAEILGVMQGCGVSACLADTGDAWLYATPIVHASDKALEPSRRRVLQVAYAAGDLPGGLEWRGV